MVESHKILNDVVENYVIENLYDLRNHFRNPKINPKLNFDTNLLCISTLNHPIKNTNLMNEDISKMENVLKCY